MPTGWPTWVILREVPPPSEALAVPSFSTRLRLKDEIIPLTAEHITAYKKATDEMSDQALRTLAAAYKPVDEKIGDRCYRINYKKPKGILYIGIPDNTCITFQQIEQHRI